MKKEKIIKAWAIIGWKRPKIDDDTSGQLHIYYKKSDIKKLILAEHDRIIPVEISLKQ